jgi:HEAT repeat protein
VLSRLDDSDPDVRLVAAQVALELRSAGAPLIDALRKRLGDADPRVRWASCVTLCTIEGDPAETLPLLERALRGKLGERAHAVDLLGQYRRPEALRLLLTVIGNVDPSSAPIDTSTSDWWTGPIVNTSGATVGQRAEAALSSMGIGVLPTLRALAASLDGETARARALAAVGRLERRPVS